MSKYKEGDAFLFRYPNADYHMVFIIAKIVHNKKKDESFVLSMVSSWKDNSRLCDEACIIDAGEHEFIKHKSYIAYEVTFLLSEKQIDKNLADGSMLLRPSLSEELLIKIKDSARFSKKINPIYKSLFLNI